MTNLDEVDEKSAVLSHVQRDPVKTQNQGAQDQFRHAVPDPR
jgi:hypothetical protein